MAIIKEMVGERVISGFKGTLDFYYYKGIACVRAWPKSPGSNRSQAVQSGWPLFSYAAKEWRNLSPVVQRTYVQLAVGTALSGRDIFSRAYMKGIFRNPIP